MLFDALRIFVVGPASHSVAWGCGAWSVGRGEGDGMDIHAVDGKGRNETYTLDAHSQGRRLGGHDPERRGNTHSIILCCCYRLSSHAWACQGTQWSCVRPCIKPHATKQGKGIEKHGTRSRCRWVQRERINSAIFWCSSSRVVSPLIVFSWACLTVWFLRCSTRGFGMSLWGFSRAFGTDQHVWVLGVVSP